MMEQTKIFLNTWQNYNDGGLGYGWMTPDEARDFIDGDPERDGGEWFICDIDNYLGVDFGNLDYANVDDIIEAIEMLENLQDWELKEVIAYMEYANTTDPNEAINEKDNCIFFSDIDEYHESCDESINFNGCDELIERYFDYDAFHRDCDYDIYEASNGVCILG
jgi:hypothetical protein